MTRARRLLAASVVAILACGLAACGSSNTTKVLFPGDCQKATYKPKSIIMTCADANTNVTGITWKSYGAKTASGSAVVNYNDCIPSCVAGKFKKIPVTVTLTRPKTCGKNEQFTVVTLVTGGAKLNGSTKLAQSFSCAKL